MIQLARLWLQHQPGSVLSAWFRERVQRNGGRGKKIVIVAMARKLLVALWKSSIDGILVDGAVIRAA
jgi:transposase